MQEKKPANRRQQDDFAVHFIRNQNRVYSYIATLLPNRTDAEEILQRTSLIMWQKWEQFEPESGFLPWARGIALNEIRNFLRRRERSNVQLSETLLTTLSDEMTESGDEDRLSALRSCLEQLEGRQKQILEQCYLESLGAKRVAQSIGLSVDAIYMRLHRIRRVLLQCIEHKLDDTNGNTQRSGA